MFSFSCRFGNTYVLMTISAFYWCATIFVAKGSSSLAGVGLMMAALAPFAIIVQCPAEVTAASEVAKAVGLWGSIRALLIAVLLTVLSEFIHVPGVFTKMTCEALEHAFDGTKNALTHALNEKKEEMNAELAIASAGTSDAESFNTASIMEPRLWKSPWQKEFLLDTTTALKKIRADILLIQRALAGDGSGKADGQVTIMQHLNRVPQSKDMSMDLQRTLLDSKKLALAVLEHPGGPFTGHHALSSVDGLDELEGLDDALEGLANDLKWPEKAPATLENDELVQLSIVIVMFEYLNSHVAEILKAGVKLC
eukprot:TRINITY_DN2020_c0_g1_i1.p1 TRINITY_DN2020_c0_g1~~TRINITY_DN2020_c0_g1_i1.p1  ORF type:complete len:333 (-),score=91.23 TRINITY_DN2020_c0_g1_i1:136-1065(-)